MQFLLGKMYSYSVENILFHVGAFEEDGMSPSFFASSSIALYYFIKTAKKLIVIGATLYVSAFFIGEDVQLRGRKHKVFQVVTFERPLLDIFICF